MMQRSSMQAMRVLASSTGAAQASSISRRALAAAASSNAPSTSAPHQAILDEIASLEVLLATAKSRLPPAGAKTSQSSSSDGPKMNIGTYNAISSQGLDVFPKDKYKVVKLEKEPKTEPHAILLRSHKLTNEQVPNSVRAVARCGAGTNNVPVEALTERGIPVFNTPGANANAVKELVVCALLLASRGVIEGINHTHTIFKEDGGDKEKVKKRIENEKKLFVGQELKGKRLGVVGLGAIGSSVAEAAINLGMEVSGYDPGLSVETAWRLPGHKMIRMTSLMPLLESADYITLHAPYSKATHHLLGRAELTKMKKNCHLVNFARGELVDTSALRAMLDNGERTGRYINDFPDEHIQGHKLVTCMPHLGASTEEAETTASTWAANQVVDFIENGSIINSVNFPTAKLDNLPSGAARLCIVNKNVPGMLGAITSTVGKFNLNIQSQFNSSRGQVAYTVVDFSTTPSADVIAQLQKEIGAIDGVLSSRLLEGNAETVEPRFFWTA